MGGNYPVLVYKLGVSAKRFFHSGSALASHASTASEIWTHSALSRMVRTSLRVSVPEERRLTLMLGSYRRNLRAQSGE